MDYFEYSFNNIPIFTYGMIGITTIVLATITMYESFNDMDESILSKLPTLTPTSTVNSNLSLPNVSLPNLNPLKEEEKTIFQGGKTKHKKEKKKNNKTKHKK